MQVLIPLNRVVLLNLRDLTLEEKLEFMVLIPLNRVVLLNNRMFFKSREFWDMS